MASRTAKSILSNILFVGERLPLPKLRGYNTLRNHGLIHTLIFPPFSGSFQHFLLCFHNLGIFSFLSVAVAPLAFRSLSLSLTLPHFTHTHSHAHSPSFLLYPSCTQCYSSHWWFFSSSSVLLNTTKTIFVAQSNKLIAQFDSLFLSYTHTHTHTSLSLSLTHTYTLSLSLTLSIFCLSYLFLHWDETDYDGFFCITEIGFCDKHETKWWMNGWMEWMINRLWTGSPKNEMKSLKLFNAQTFWQLLMNIRIRWIGFESCRYFVSFTWRHQLKNENGALKNPRILLKVSVVSLCLWFGSRGGLGASYVCPLPEGIAQWIKHLPATPAAGVRTWIWPKIFSAPIL